MNKPVEAAEMKQAMDVLKRMIDGGYFDDSPLSSRESAQLVVEAIDLSLEQGE